MVQQHKAYIPTIRFSNLANPRRNIQGKGASVLLQKGGAGGASSYSGIDDYVATTGRNPYVTTSGSGLPSVQQVKRFGQKVVNEAKPSLDKMSKTLESLTLKVPKPNKIKNIRFNL